MSDRKLAKAVQRLFRQIGRLSRRLTKALVTWLLRTALVTSRRRSGQRYRNSRHATAGFVLPTTVLLVLVVSLTTGALTYRAYNNSTRAIGETQNRIIYNAGTPAIDRARAKIDYLFNRDGRLPGGVPSVDLITAMMLNDPLGNDPTTGKPIVKVNNVTVPREPETGDDPYNLPGETRVDINGDTKQDNAWTYRTDTNGDGQPDATVVYSVVFSVPPGNDNGTPSDSTDDTAGWKRLVSLNDADKAIGLDENSDRLIPYPRGGPLSNATGTGCAGGETRVEAGWYQDPANSSNLRKNFQVDVFVLPDATRNGGASNFSTLEFQQDRRLDRGNKWGAWFRNDLEIFPGANFNWNGAMHTDGSLIIGSDRFTAYPISSPASCFYTPASSSEITVAEKGDFTGVIASGRLLDDTAAGASTVYQALPGTPEAQTLSPDSDWWANAGATSEITLNPAEIVVRDGYKARGGDGTNSGAFSANTLFGERFKQDDKSVSPYVDDLYRADNRYGPKPRYTPQIGISGNVGDKICPTSPNDVPTLCAEDKAVGASEADVGLDGYWERRARNEGMRILVGQRLELGNSNGWVTPQDRPTAFNAATLAQTTASTGNGNFSDVRKADYSAVNVSNVTDLREADVDFSDAEGDPLYPPYSLPSGRGHEAKERRALRDNTAAVQSTAVYHTAFSKDYPIACLASTAHPGSPFTLQQSVNFLPTYFAASGSATRDTALLTDFFNGRGTNGWEFAPPGGGTEGAFITAVTTPTNPLRIALENLANFAGDRDGAYPPVQRPGEIHPDPFITMWGNFSNLRRTLGELTNAADYTARLSPADRTYLHTAACTLGMLAYNVQQVQKYDPTNIANDSPFNGTNYDTLVTDLAEDLWQLMDGQLNNGEVLPREQLSTYNYGAIPASGPVKPENYNPRDYDRVPAEAYISKLREKLAIGGTADPNNAKVRLAELILTRFQVRRDRTYGFRASPAANTWNYNPYIVNLPGARYGGTTAPTSVVDADGQTSLWSSACDPNLFALKDPDPAATAVATPPITGDYLAAIDSTGGVAAQPDSPNKLALHRLALSRLCGTVIPPAAIHDYPGDLHYPARANSTPTPAGTALEAYGNTQYLPRKTADNALLENSGAFATNASFSAASDSTTPPQLGQIQTAFRSDTTNAISQAPYSNDPLPPVGTAPTTPVQDFYKLASVAPKWPSLYYLFPEIEHDQDGDVSDVTTSPVSYFTAAPADENPASQTAALASASATIKLDHGQPTGSLRPVGGSTALVNAFQPWKEPYIEATAGINPGYTYKRVSTALIPGAVREQTYIRRIDFTASGGGAGVPATYNYRTFGFPIDDLAIPSDLALAPRILTGTAVAGASGAGQLPSTTSLTTGENTPPNRITAPTAAAPNAQGKFASTTVAIPFLDRVLFNGREWQPSRVLDVDLGMLRRNAIGSEVWLPTSGIIYAFREDAVREDAISRPANASAACQDSPALDGGSALGCTHAENANPATQSDPSLSLNNISVKSVDFVPDPDRRVHGFRLRNGSQLRRATSIIPADDDRNKRGMSFFTDDPVYVMGNFNLHRDGADDSAGSLQEEFIDTLQQPGATQYTATDFFGRTNRNANFAKPITDRWRPSEILADSITMLSENFCDGSTIESFILSPGTNDPTSLTQAAAYQQGALYGPGCTNNGNRTSFLNQNRPTDSLSNDEDWLTENPVEANRETTTAVRASGDPHSNPTEATGFLQRAVSAYRISRNGNPMRVARKADNNFTGPDGAANSPEDFVRGQKPPVPVEYSATGSSPVGYSANAFQDYTGTGDKRPLSSPTETTVNAITVSGSVPSRRYQSYGGLHNFPRFLEDWGGSSGTPFRFAGSFLQLNFSNYATAPYDQDSWEANAPANSDATERINYYQAPPRLWGYDVGLQISPAGPAAARFVTPGTDRNEFYNEPAANDPYIRNLCVASGYNRCPS